MNRPINTRVSVADSDVIKSGTVITQADLGLKIHVHDLIYEIVFDDDAEKQAAALERVSEQHIRIRLSKFTNSLGTSLRFLKIGTAENSDLTLSLFVEAIGKEVKVVSFTLYLGGNLE